jgi:hypothetical protein
MPGNFRPFIRNPAILPAIAGIGALVLATVGLATTAQAQTISAEDLARRTVERRAAEAVIWGMPAVNFDLVFQAMLKAGGKENEIVYWTRFLDWKNQTLTPNPSTIYLMPFINTKEAGPMVLELPAATEGSVTGTITDAWQCAIEDVGPAGADKGKGGKYLILPPGYGKQVPQGYIVLRASTYMAGPLLRSNVTGGSAADIASAVAYGKRIKLYPIAQAANPPATTFIDAIETAFDSTIPYNIRFFETLDRFVQREPWLDRDKAMIDQLKSIGIEQGKPFNPGAEKREILEQAAREAKALLDVRYEALFTPYYPGGRWALPVAPDVVEGLANNFSKPGVYPVDDRGALYSFAYCSVKHLGSGQFYLVTIKDKAGEPLSGVETYRLIVPANAPVELYWSATAYDRETHALVKNVARSSRGSNVPEVQKNQDGSVEVYFGPKVPAGKDSNWVPTDPQRGFEVMMRFYGPRKPLFDKTWKLPDIEKVN